ncbi:MAG: hypothetical protein ACK58L_07290 [Planctomycetota bacterium]
MPRLCVYFGFGCVLFVLGLTAGRSITDGATLVDLVTDSPELAGRDVSSVRGCCPGADELTLDSELNTGLRMTASLPTLADVGKEPQTDSDSFSTTLASQTQETLAAAPVEFATDSRDSSAAVSADGVARDDLIRLIRQMIPAADEATALVWADSYAGMDLADVEFILEQKRRHDLHLTASTALSSEFPAAVSTTHVPAGQGSGAVLLGDAIDSNLREAMTIGYRRMTVLTEPGSMSPANDTRNSGSRPNAVSFRSFDKGRVVSSPVATHVSLESDSACEMFLLENNRLTRRGDFQRLPDGTFGLLIAGQEFRLAGSPTNLDSSATLQVNEFGDILSSASDTETKTWGRIQVVRVANCNSLATHDGVVFEAPSNSSFSPVDPVRLDPGTLELSNVNVEDEWQLRTILKASDNHSARNH